MERVNVYGKRKAAWEGRLEEGAGIVSSLGLLGRAEGRKENMEPRVVVSGNAGGGTDGE